MEVLCKYASDHHHPAAAAGAVAEAAAAAAAAAAIAEVAAEAEAAARQAVAGSLEDPTAMAASRRSRFATSRALGSEEPAAGYSRHGSRMPSDEGASSAARPVACSGQQQQQQLLKQEELPQHEPQQAQQLQPQQQQQQQQAEGKARAPEPNMSDDSSELNLELNDHDATEALLALQSSLPLPLPVPSTSASARDSPTAFLSRTGSHASRFGSPRVSSVNAGIARRPVGVPGLRSIPGPAPCSGLELGLQHKGLATGHGLGHGHLGMGMAAPTRGNSLQSSCSMFLAAAAAGVAHRAGTRSSLASEGGSQQQPCPGAAPAGLLPRPNSTVDDRELMAPEHEALDSEQEEAQARPRQLQAGACNRAGSEADQAHRRLVAASLMLQAISQRGV
jgi:hypothetical protein